MKIGERLLRKIFGKRRIERLVGNARVTGSARESITAGPLEIIIEDRRPKSIQTREVRTLKN